MLGPVDPGTSNQTSLSNCPNRAAAGYPACNDDYRITNYLNNPSSPTSPFDPSNGVSFNAATRMLSTSNSHPAITLGGGIYNFCEVDILNNASIILAPGVKVEIFIDSPDDPDSGLRGGNRQPERQEQRDLGQPQQRPDRPADLRLRVQQRLLTSSTSRTTGTAPASSMHRCRRST